MRAKSSCPHCGKRDCFDKIAINNAETYGGGSYNMKCIRCNKEIVVYLSRIVIIDEILKGDKDDIPSF
jgi:hypothetical protein